MYESGPFGEASGGPVPVAVETFHALRQRQTGEGMAANAENPSRVNLLNWDGRGSADGDVPAMRRLRPSCPRRNAATRSLQDRLVWQAASLLLAYPDEQLAERLRHRRRAAASAPPARRRSCWPARSRRCRCAIRCRPRSTTSTPSTCDGAARCT